jgi:hypothetical protein
LTIRGVKFSSNSNLVFPSRKGLRDLVCSNLLRMSDLSERRDSREWLIWP